MDAAIEGLVDYSKARLLDGRWWRRLDIFLEALARKKDAAVIEAKYRFYLAQTASSRISEDSFKKAQELAGETFLDIVGSLKPWQGRNFKQRKGKEITGHRQAYVDRFGIDPADPEFKKWEAAEIIRLKEAHDAKAAEQASQKPAVIIARRQREMEEKKKRKGVKT